MECVPVIDIKLTKAGCHIIIVIGIEDIGGLINVRLFNLLVFEFYLNSVANYYITSILNTVLLTRQIEVQYGMLRSVENNSCC